MEERPYSSRLKKVGELLDQDSVTREEVVSELGAWTLVAIGSPTPVIRMGQWGSGPGGRGHGVGLPITL